MKNQKNQKTTGNCIIIEGKSGAARSDLGKAMKDLHNSRYFERVYRLDLENPHLSDLSPWDIQEDLDKSKST